MVALNGFNAHQVTPDAGGFKPWPAGWYPVVIVKSEEKPTKENDGYYLQFNVMCIDGPMKDQRNYLRLNWKNKSTKAVEIANGQLSAICHVTGVFTPPTTEALHNIPFQISYSFDPKANDGLGSNECKGFRDINGNEPGKAGAAGAPAAAQPQGYGGQPQGQPPQNYGQPQGGYAAPQGGWNGAPQGQPGGQPGWGAPGGQFQPGPNGTEWGAPPAGAFGQGAPQGQPQQQAPQGGGWGGGQPTQAAPQGQPGGQPGWGAPGGQPAGAPQGQPQGWGGGQA